MLICSPNIEVAEALISTLAGNARLCVDAMTWGDD